MPATLDLEVRCRGFRDLGVRVCTVNAFQAKLSQFCNTKV